MSDCVICENPITETDRLMRNAFAVVASKGGGEAHKVCAGNAQRLFT
jgi:hypothetical protein